MEIKNIFSRGCTLKNHAISWGNRGSTKIIYFWYWKREFDFKINNKGIGERSNSKLWFAKYLIAIQPTLTLEDVPERSSNLRASSSLLLAVRKYVGDDIHKRIDLIL